MVSSIVKIMLLSIALNSTVIFSALTYYHSASFSQSTLAFAEQQLSDEHSLQIKEARSTYISIRNIGEGSIPTKYIEIVLDDIIIECAWGESEISYASAASCTLEKRCKNNQVVKVFYKTRLSDVSSCF